MQQHTFSLPENFIVPKLLLQNNPITNARVLNSGCASIASLQPEFDSLNEEVERLEEELRTVREMEVRTRNEYQTQLSRIEELEKKIKSKRPSVPRGWKPKIWQNYFGTTIASALCPVCLHRTITTESFQACHVIAHSRGGKMELSNLFPGCAKCNGSMVNEDARVYTQRVQRRELELPGLLAHLRRV